MTTYWFFIVCHIAVIASALVSGAFLAFSDFIMRSLGGSQTTAGVEVMQVINRKIMRSLFMVLFLGMAALSPYLIGHAYFALNGSAATWTMAGGALYFFGVFMLTAVCNVPMNNRLDTLEYTGSEAATYWKRTYLPRWTIWNHVRTLASAGASICFLIACIALARATMAAG